MNTIKTFELEADEMEDFNFMFDQAAKIVTYTLNGRMDTIRSNGAMETFRREFEGLLSAGVSTEEVKICFDMGGVDYISSSFLRLCITSAKAIKKGNFSIINTGPEIMKVFKIAGLEEMLNVS